MLRRVVRLASLLVFLACCTVADAANVELFGVPVNPNDLIGAEITSSLGRTATINVGFEHGVIQGSRFWVFRPGERGYERVNSIEVVIVKRKSATAKALGPRALRKRDRVVILAAELNLWRAKRQDDDQLRLRLVLQKANRRYDTRDDQFDEEDQLLGLKKQDARQMQEWMQEVSKHRLLRRIFVDTARLRKVWKKERAEYGYLRSLPKRSKVGRKLPAGSREMNRLMELGIVYVGVTLDDYLANVERDLEPEEADAVGAKPAAVAAPIPKPKVGSKLKGEALARQIAELLRVMDRLGNGPTPTRR